MRIAELNMLPYGSTGHIMLDIAKVANSFGHETRAFAPRFYQRGAKVAYPQSAGLTYFGSPFENMLHLRLSQATGMHGCFSYFGTRELLRYLDDFRPDVLHLHNLHNWTIDLPLLFSYVKEKKIRTVWTLHDCWSFTGHCSLFDAIGCDKWKTKCHHCPQYKEYPKTFVDSSACLYRLKKKWFSNVPDLTLVTPSAWLAGLVKESFLKDYPVRVINNGIDLRVFKPTPSDFRERYGIGNRHILLGVAFGWGRRKGLDVFIDLAERLDREKYQIVLVGTNENTERSLPAHILSIRQTQDQAELAEIYTAADVFVNPTREENYPTVNMEAIACGTPVLTFDTGGSPEILDSTCGSVVPKSDIQTMHQEILRICETRPYSEEACLAKARSFDKNEKYKEYICLYENCTHSTECILY